MNSQGLRVDFEAGLLLQEQEPLRPAKHEAA